jgi:membrane protein DedA with SNARE-associated domain
MTTIALIIAFVGMCIAALAYYMIGYIAGRSDERERNDKRTK